MDSDRPLNPGLPRCRPRRRVLELVPLLALTFALGLSSSFAHAQQDPTNADSAATQTSPSSDVDQSASANAADENAESNPDRDEDEDDAFAPLRTTQMCIDETIANRLAVKRRRREAVDRLFVKQARHELSAMGGYYSSDLFSGTYVASASYTYHVTETIAVEFGGAYTNANADIIRAIEDRRATVIDDDFARVILAESLLLWSPIYGKLRLGGTILRFDLNAGIGVGVVDAATSRGAAGVAGVGMKLFLGRALAFRIDARNHVFQQELLDSQFLVNDLSITSGISLFLPFQN